MTVEEELAAAKAKVEELEQKHAEAETELEKQKGIADNAEAKFHEMAAETGANRKAVAEAAQAVLDANKAKDEALNNLSSVSNELTEEKKKSVGPTADGGNKQKTVEEQLEEMTAELTDDDQKVLDAAFEAADDETKKAIASDKGTYLEFLKGLRESQAESGTVLPPWRKKPAPEPAASGDAAKKELKKLFNKEQECAGFVPPGPSGGTPREKARVARESRKPKTGWMS